MGTRTDSLRTVSALLFPARVHGGASDGKENGTVAAGDAGGHLCGLTAVWSVRFFAGADWAVDY